MAKYVWIGREYVWIYDNSQYVGTCLEMDVLRNLSKMYDIWKIIIAFNYFRKTLHFKSLKEFWICVVFKISQLFEYSRTVNMPGFWVSRVTRGLPIFCKYDRVLSMRRDAIMKGFWNFEDSEYARFLHMQALHKVLNMLEYGWIMPG